MPEAAVLASGVSSASQSAAGELRTAVAGVSGYAGGELVRLLLGHPRLSSTPPLLLGRRKQERRVQGSASDGSAGDVGILAAADAATVALISLHPELAGLPHAGELSTAAWDWKDLERAAIDLLFLATPHQQSRAWVPDALEHGIRVVDLSGAWRLHCECNRRVYQLEDARPELATKLQQETVYGSPELHGPHIASARLVANPGCYATSIILALAPLLRAHLVDLDHGIICDSKSGVSGAGKAPTANTHFMHAADNLSAYAVFGHRHTGELLEQLHLTANQIQFTPHLLPIPRGILSTMYMRLNQPGSVESIQNCLDEFYAGSPMVRVRHSPALPQIQYVVRTSFCDIGFQLSPDGRRLVVVSCLDNLLKGAASQAVQNMNLMAGWPEAEGLL